MNGRKIEAEEQNMFLLAMIELSELPGLGLQPTQHRAVILQILGQDMHDAAIPLDLAGDAHEGRP